VLWAYELNTKDVDLTRSFLEVFQKNLNEHDDSFVQGIGSNKKKKARAYDNIHTPER
jgi:hypothetical protein